jgi:hypothetical protein
MKMVDLHDKVQITMTYTEAEFMWNVLNALSSDEVLEVADLTKKHINIAGKLEEKLDEYVNS